MLDELKKKKLLEALHGKEETSEGDAQESEAEEKKEVIDSDKKKKKK